MSEIACVMHLHLKWLAEASQARKVHSHLHGFAPQNAQASRRVNAIEGSFPHD